MNVDSIGTPSANTAGLGLLRVFLVDERRRLGLATALLSIAATLELVPHIIVYAVAVSVLSPPIEPRSLYGLAAIAMAGVVLRFVLLGVGYILSHAVAFRIVHRLRLALIDKLRRVPASFLSEHPSGDLKKTIVDDAASLENVFAHNLPELTSGLFVPIVAALILLWTDWRMALAGLVLLPVAFIVQMINMSGFEEGWRQWHAAESRANAGVLEFIRGIAVLKAFDRDASSLARVRDGIYGIRDLATDITRRGMAGYTLFFSLMSNNLLLVLPTGLALYLSGTTTREELVFFVVLGAAMLTPLMKLLFLFGDAQKVRVAIDRIQVVLAADELSEPKNVPEKFPTTVDVHFEHVDFTYPGRKSPAIENITMMLRPGTINAIVGPSGAGKTTLAKLLTRAYDVSHGEISIAGVDLRHLNADQRTGLIGHVSQDAILFDGTIRDNLSLARPDASQAELETVARAAHAHEFIQALPAGYDTELGDRGSRLSGGERQRLTIARALLKRAPVVVLDEVTANVDPQSERGIQAGLTALAKDRTILVVAHRLRSVVDADRIFVMDSGHMVDSGSHDELLARCPLYATLWKDQEDASNWALGGES